jgi:hypothetical protein
LRRPRGIVWTGALVGAATSCLGFHATAWARGDVPAASAQERPAPAAPPPAPPPPLPPLPAEAPQGDVVESIVPEGPAPRAPSPARAAPAAEPAPPAYRTDFSGWARESLEWTLAPAGFRQGAPSPYDVPHDRLISRTQLFARASYVRGRWFEATISGVLGYSFREQGPSGTDIFDGVDGQTTSADPEADLRELYLGFFSNRVDFRVGQQRVAWGRSDTRSPNDILNARDLRDPILTEDELRHVPTPLLRVDFDLGAVTIQAVGTPVFVPDVYDVYGTNWAAIQGDAPAPIRGLFGSVSPLFDPTKQGSLNALVHDTQLPRSNWEAPSGGLKVAVALPGADLDFYYHYGFDGTPAISVSPSFKAFLGGEAFATFQPSDLTPILQALDMGTPPFTAQYVRRHHVGFDAATSAGPFAFRLDAAYDTQRVYYQAADLTSFVSPTFSSVASVEYQTGDLDKVVLFELTYDRIVDAPGQPLLGYDQDTVAVAGTVRWPIEGGWVIDLRGLTGIEPVTLALEPALRWKATDALWLKAGAVLLDGENNSFGWYFRHNTSAFLQAKYSF